MKGVVILGDRNLTLSDFPDPSAGPREVVLQIKASDMCGSDLHKESLRPRPMPTFDNWHFLKCRRTEFDRVCLEPTAPSAPPARRGSSSVAASIYAACSSGRREHREPACETRQSNRE
jgi:hypothetical protein